MNKALLQKNLQQLEKNFPNEVLPKEKLPLLPKEKEFSLIPLENYSVENLRFMIQQGFGLKFLIPMAIRILKKDPFANENLYNGSLLSAVLTVSQTFWQKFPSLYQDIEEILKNFESKNDAETKEILTVFLPQKIHNFRKSSPIKDE